MWYIFTVMKQAKKRKRIGLGGRIGRRNGGAKRPARVARRKNDEEGREGWEKRKDMPVWLVV
jgi:hypothetical protein